VNFVGFNSQREKNDFCSLAKVIFLEIWLVAGVTFSARESVDILTVEVAFFACHFQVTPDRSGEVRGFFGELLLTQLLAGIL
jgi:hypothetical protein